MAITKQPTYFNQQVNAGEEKLLKFLEVNLPDDFYLIPNIELVSTNPHNNQTQYWEYDLVVVAPHAVFNIENKDWRGRIEGDETNWYLNDHPRKNPLRTNRQKTAILHSKFKEIDPYWGQVRVINMLTLSYDNVLDRYLTAEDEKLTFDLDKRLINFLTDASEVNKAEDAIADIQHKIVDYLTGQQNKKRVEEKTQIFEYEIVKVLDQTNFYTEYLIKYPGASSTFRVAKEFTLQVAGLSPMDLKNREDKIRNQYNALKNLNGKPFILNVDFRFDPENHLFYEISDFLADRSLRAEARIKTFTFNEKVQFLKNIMVALRSAHEQNIYHRDISPDNIYLNSGFAYLANFGKSYFFEHEEEGYTVMPSITEQNVTPYQPLELTVGDVSAVTDIYALGVLAYWMFLEKEPFKSPYELNQLGGHLPKRLMPTTINPHLPQWIDEFINKTIQTNEMDREAQIEKLYEFIEEATNLHTKGFNGHQEPATIPVAVPFDELKEGDDIGDYTIYKTLGKGGYSRVFKVKHKLQGEYYTLKMFNESVNVNSVIDEFKALEQVHHPNIVKFKWNGTTFSGQFYTLMEYLEGDNLGVYSRTEAKLPIHQVYNVAKDILSALVEMQKVNPPIIHRDIKPQNIIWDKGERFVLIDFNVATAIDNNQDYVGTNPYLAQDLIYDGYRVKWDLTADLFSLGVTLYELLTKKYPWTPSKLPLIHAQPKDPKEFEPNVSRAFADFILKAIKTNKETRFHNAAEMLEELLRIENDILELSEDTGEMSNRAHLYHTQISISQSSNGFNVKLYNRNNTYIDLHESIQNVLSRFKENLTKYKSSLDLGKPIKLVVKVDDEYIINEVFWQGGAKSFTDGNVERIYQALTELFDKNKEELKVKKINTEGVNMVDYLNSLYSQSKYGNFGTRVNLNGNTLDNDTYTSTKLDRKLIPAIVDGKYKLVIITGNAGDGKTAFVKKIEQNANVKELTHFEHNNGAQFKINGVKYESNYDGSQDEKGFENNDVLDKFFSPFENLQNYNKASEGRIIAINEGRLVEFLTTSEKHKGLDYAIENYFYEEGYSQLPEGVLVINLNLRSVVAQDENEESLFKKQIRALTHKQLWTKCEGCEFAHHCFIKYNVDSFNDSAAGPEIINRLEWLIRTVSLKRELHITMRDLRSFIAFIITRDYACEELKLIPRLTEEDIVNYWNLYYFNISNPKIQDSGNSDRLIKLIRETDIGEVAIPKLDRQLFFSPHKPKDYLIFGERENNLLDQFNEQKALSPVHQQNAETIALTKEKHKTFVRHQYFEGNINFDEIKQKEQIQLKPTFLNRIPYQSIFEFVQSIKASDNLEELKVSLSKAISINEGANNTKIAEKYLILSSNDIKDPYGKAFKLLPLEDFELIVYDTSHLTKYLEYETDALIFRHKKMPNIALTISLDLYEMLYFIHKGFSPSLNDMKGKFIELIVFKNLLENLNYNEVVVTANNKDFFKISKSVENKIEINPLLV